MIAPRTESYVWVQVQTGDAGIAKRKQNNDSALQTWRALFDSVA